jgi:hypothetical protein
MPIEGIVTLTSDGRTENSIVTVCESRRMLGARLLMPDIKSLVSDRTICVSCQEMPTWMEVAMDERVS